MSEEEKSAGRPPLGSWARLYLLVCISAILMMALLYWLTASFNHPMGKA